VGAVGERPAGRRRLRAAPLVRHREETRPAAGVLPEPVGAVEDSAEAVAEACS
jgi:hypothetical protein